MGGCVGEREGAVCRVRCLAVGREGGEQDVVVVVLSRYVRGDVCVFWGGGEEAMEKDYGGRACWVEGGVGE
jgi:hypothetical protein